MKKSRRQSFCHTHSFWLFVLPSLALFAVFFLVPLVLSIWFSFTNYDGCSDALHIEEPGYQQNYFIRQ